MDSFANDIQVGGRTVKNVAGLDVTRLMVGSMGELGILHQATLRTYSLPEEVARIDLELKSLDTLAQQITDWMISPVYPDSIALRRLGDAWHLEVSYFGRSKANDVQVNALKNSLTQIPDIQIIDQRRSTLAEHFKHGQQSRAWQRKSKALMRIIAPPRDLTTVINTLAELGITQLSGMPAQGGLFAGGPLTLEIDEKILKVLNDCGGMRMWITPPPQTPEFSNAPTPIASAFDKIGAPCIAPFAPVQSDWSFMQKIRQTMDPQGLFNPGRFLNGEVAQ
ncbi:MAG: FAD-binding oxidoreductase [Phycisphaeraceae bacterium]|nr:FAD-binding oxidoreductase [Phycisphaeraceae bacterium]